MRIYQKLFNHSNKKTNAFLKKSLCFGIILLFLIVPIKTVKSDCGTSLSKRDAQQLSFIHLDLLAWQSDYAPYLMGFQVIENYYDLGRRDIQHNDNIGEWRGRFCDIPDSSDIEEVLYDSQLDELIELREAAAKKHGETLYSLSDNTFAQVLQQNHCIETIDYLIYAKNCEKYCVQGDKWNDKKPLNADMAYYIAQGDKLFRRTDAPFLRLRYVYQMVRLAHYMKDYTQVLRIWDEFIPKTQRIQSIINYWALGHRAGALLKLGRRAEAAYLYAVIFRYCPSKRQQAFESFDIRTEREWQDCLGFCKNAPERAALYAIRASYDKAHALEDMAELYRLDPKNEHLDMLLIRETLRLEKIMLSAKYRNGRYDAATIQKTRDYLNRLTVFVGNVAAQNLVKKPALWRTTEAYLTLLNGDIRKALNDLIKARALAINDPLLQEQIDNYAMVARIIGLQMIDTKTGKINTYLDTTLTDIRNSNAYASDPDFETLLYEKLGIMYRQNGNNGAALLCQYSLGELETNPTLDVLNDLIALCQKREKTSFERELTLKGDSATIESDVWDLRGRYHLAHFQLEAAAEAFLRVPARERKRRFTPFTDHIKDCVMCLSSDTAGVMSRLTFVQQMLDLESRVRSMSVDPSMSASAAPYYYKLGLGYYNMTYFGNSSGLADAYRSGQTWQRIQKGSNVFPSKRSPLGNFEVLDCAIALNYFEKARVLSWNSDRELSAKAAFAAAKCQQNLFFMSTENRYKIGSRLAPDVPPPYRTYFELLKNYYGNTQFLGKARTECRYFDYYMRR